MLEYKFQKRYEQGLYRSETKVSIEVAEPNKINLVINNDPNSYYEEAEVVLTPQEARELTLVLVQAAWQAENSRI